MPFGPVPGGSADAAGLNQRAAVSLHQQPAKQLGLP
jgi:hypothetical protein